MIPDGILIDGANLSVATNATHWIVSPKKRFFSMAVP
jgi:hypothetical protein